jgi:hypothetical protein
MLPVFEPERARHARQHADDFRRRHREDLAHVEERTESYTCSPSMYVTVLPPRR